MLGIKSVLEYGAQIWNGSLTSVQSNDIERIQKRAKIVGMICVIKRMSKPEHKLHHLLPKTVSHTR